MESIFESFPVEKAPGYMKHVENKELDHIAKGSLTFSHKDLDPHTFIRAQMRADRDFDCLPAEEEEEEEGSVAYEESDIEREKDEEGSEKSEEWEESDPYCPCEETPEFRY
ncbi:hypothetical protein PMAYCL1PPCAC_29361 [Pristionchus mayeri]|uniref:Uncharacterized protein n=1 Tax=Pristionchus mayeri TaxID=1317129 RepID=A0AAN5D9B9_9BILA|nr:hypothetical protein PMAYCL1PPCAC_29361 [Pristionchus mayeri]